MITLYPLVCLGRDYSLGVSGACRKGYKVVPFPGVVHNKGGYAKNLHSSAIRLIKETPAGKGGKGVMYNEADFLVQAECEVLEKIIAKAPEDWEVLSFANDLLGQVYEAVKSEEGVEWKYRPRLVGTQALMFRDDKAAKAMLNLWESNPDYSIDMATQLASLKQYVPNKYLITQSHSLNFEDWPLPRDRRFLVCMTSYRRVKDAFRQIYAFMDQSYDNFIFQVFLRGVSEYDWKKVWEPSFHHFLADGRLVVRCESNGTQLGNVTQFGEGVNPDAYDLVLKVDDDDWYDRDYLLRLNRVHQSFDLDVGSWQDTVSGIYHQVMGYPGIDHGVTHFFGGNQIVIPKQVLALAREYYLSDCNPKIIIPVLGEKMGSESWTWREDNLIVQLMVRMGMIDRSYLTPPPPGMMVTRSGASVTRAGTGISYYSGGEHLLLTIREGERMGRVLVQGNVMLELKRRKEGEEVRKWDIVSNREGEYILQVQGEKEYKLLERLEDGSWEMKDI